MAIVYDDILNLTDDHSASSKFMQAIPDGNIKLRLDDRPEVWLNKRTSPHFFLDAKKRYQVLASILGFNFESQLRSLIDFVNEETDQLINHHYSLHPVKTDFDSIKIGKVSLIQLEATKFDNFIEAHTFRFSDEVFGAFPDQAHNFPPEYRLLVATEVQANRLNRDYNSHLFFDLLHDISRSQNIVLHFLQHFSGKYFPRSGSILTDSFPNAGCSWSSKFKSSELESLTIDDLINVESIVMSLESYTFYRLLIGSEISNKDIYSRLVILRAILDPFFEENASMVRTAKQLSGKNKTEVQAKLILKSLANNNARYSNDLQLSELVQFLKIRNSFIHPSPTEDLTSLHILHDKVSVFRKVIYEFFLTTFLHNITNGKNLFTANTSAPEIS